MNREEQYYRSLNALANAYLKDQLNEADPCACAVGNIIADAMGFDLVRLSNSGYFYWTHGGKFVNINWNKYIPMTGYSFIEMHNIEVVFMGTDGDNFKKLLALVKYLDVIHEVDESGKKYFKNLLKNEETVNI